MRRIEHKVLGQHLDFLIFLKNCFDCFKKKKKRGCDRKDEILKIGNFKIFFPYLSKQKKKIGEERRETKGLPGKTPPHFGEKLQSSFSFCFIVQEEDIALKQNCNGC